MAETSRRGLGRGLSALLGETDVGVSSAPEAPQGEVRSGAHDTPIELLRRNPDQPRRRFDETELDELAGSIREKGVLQPILVRPALGAPGEFQIVAGERRWRAAQRAGLHAVPILVRDLTDAEVLEIGIVENVQRADLDPIDEAAAYRALIERFGHTQDAVARIVGKSRSHVANAMRLLALPEAVRDHLAAGRLTSGHARAIASSPDPGSLAETIVAKGLSVRQAEEMGREAQERPVGQPLHGAGRRKARGAASRDADVRALETDLSEQLGLTVELRDRHGEGELVVRYATLEQLDELCRRLMA